MRPNAWILSVFLSVLFGVAGCDQVSKQVASSALAGAGCISVANDTVRLELTSNAGAFLSLGARLPEVVREVLFLGVVPLVVLCLCGHLMHTRHASVPVAIGLGLVVGGGLANWLDRILHHGVVIDFISVGLGRLRTGIFNVADVAVVAGAALLVVLTRRGDTATGGQAA